MLAFDVLPFFQELAVEFHLDLLDGRRDHVRRDVDQVTLDLKHFVDRQTARVRLVVHLKILYLLKPLLWLPLDALFLLPDNRRGLTFFDFLIALPISLSFGRKLALVVFLLVGRGVYMQ